MGSAPSLKGARSQKKAKYAGLRTQEVGVWPTYSAPDLLGAVWVHCDSVHRSQLAGRLDTACHQAENLRPLKLAEQIKMVPI